jgi:nucleotide-binding universal stress UspA family protein
MNIQSILVVTDLSAREDIAIERAWQLADTHRASITLMYVPPRGQQAAPTAASRLAYREQCLKHARHRIVSLTDSFDARRNRVLATIGRGDPGRQAVIQQERSGADLVVLGKKRSTAWEDFFLGSIAHRVLSWGSSDVLVVPDAYLQATAPVAARRIEASAGRNMALPLQSARRTS